MTGADAAPIQWLIELIPGTEEALTEAPAAPPTTTQAEPVEAEIEVGMVARLSDLIVFAVRRHLAHDLRAVVFPLGGGERGAALGATLGLPDLDQLFGYLVGGLTLLGAAILMWRHASLFVLAALLYGAALVFWVWEGPRLLYPVQPQLHLMFAVGVATVGGWLLGRGRRVTGDRLAGQLALTALFLLVALFTGGKRRVASLDPGASRTRRGSTPSARMTTVPGAPR